MYSSTLHANVRQIKALHAEVCQTNALHAVQRTNSSLHALSYHTRHPVVECGHQGILICPDHPASAGRGKSETNVREY
jgi:hypothetical protein